MNMIFFKRDAAKGMPGKEEQLKEVADATVFIQTAFPRLSEKEARQIATELVRTWISGARWAGFAATAMLTKEGNHV